MPSAWRRRHAFALKITKKKKTDQDQAGRRRFTSGGFSI
jgi:hypothetical protein